MCALATLGRGPSLHLRRPADCKLAYLLICSCFLLLQLLFVMGTNTMHNEHVQVLGYTCRIICAVALRTTRFPVPQEILRRMSSNFETCACMHQPHTAAFPEGIPPPHSVDCSPRRARAPTECSAREAQSPGPGGAPHGDDPWAAVV